MRKKFIYIFCICFLFSGLIKSQEIEDKEEDNKKSKIKYTSKMFVGADLFTPVLSMFSDKKSYEGFLAYQFNSPFSAVAELGYEKNIYTKNYWNVDAKGLFARIGINYIVSKDYYNQGNGFYIGGRLGFSPFKQTIKAYPRTIKNAETEQAEIIDETGSFEQADVASLWLEFVGGAKVRFGKTPFYGEIMIRPKFMLYQDKQENIDNLVTPGFGKDKGTINFIIFWGISYRIF